jgi:uncharacterized membrane-anchored protein YitT (DUF2179 family)
MGGFMLRSENDITRFVKNSALTVAGTLVLAFGTAVFIIPFGLVAGGISGVSIVVSTATGGRLSVDLLVTLFSLSLFAAGAFLLGKDFAVKTLVSSLVYPIGVWAFGRLAEPSALGGFFSLAESAYPQLAVLLSSVFGGLLVGAGCAVTFLGGGSTGGVDIVAFALCKYFPKLKSPRVIFALDAAVILFGAFVERNLVLTLLGVITAFVSAAAVDKIFLGASQAFEARIISEKHAEINRAVIERLKRTTTLSDVVGGYTGKPRKLVRVSFTRAEYAELMEIILSLDDRAFVSVHRVFEIGGEGWRKLSS